MPAIVNSAEAAEKSCCGCFRKKKVKEELCNNESFVNVSYNSADSQKKMPFTADLPKDLIVGKTICISGNVLPTCPRFALNLTCGKGPLSDIALHLNPRFHQRYVVRNSRLNGQWGDEETTMPIKFPFERNKDFALEIFIAKGEFLVALDGVHIFSYKFRIPITKLTTIEVQGPVEIYKVEFKQLEMYPETISKNRTIALPLGRRMMGGDDDGERDETATDTPVTFLLPQGFQPDWQLEIYGRVKILPHSFYINLQEGSHLWPHPVIPLHLNPRFNTGHGEPVFVRNAWLNGKWGQEERTPGFQFSPATPFTMLIRRGHEHFSVWINGKLAGEFKFRTVTDKIDTLYIQGDLDIKKVVLDDKPAPQKLPL